MAEFTGAFHGPDSARPDEKLVRLTTAKKGTATMTAGTEKWATLILLNQEQFIKLLFEHHDKREPQYQALLPPREVRIPVTRGYVSREEV